MSIFSTAKNAGVMMIALFGSAGGTAIEAGGKVAGGVAHATVDGMAGGIKGMAKLAGLDEALVAEAVKPMQTIGHSGAHVVDSIGPAVGGAVKKASHLEI